MATALKPIKKGFLIKHKLALLIIMPLFLVLFFLFREVGYLDKQITSLKKAQATITFLDMLFDNDIDHKKVKEVVKINSLNHKEETPHNHYKTSEVWDSIGDKTKIMFETFEDRIFFNNLLFEFKEGVELMENAKNINNSYFLFKKHVESHKKLLMGVEKIYYPKLILSVDNHLRSIYQLEWLMFWAQEESIYIRLLLEGNYNDEKENEIINQIRILIQNQNLFLDRFIVINTNKESGVILLSAINKKDLDKKISFRNKFLDGTSNVDILKNDKKDVAMESIASRLHLLKQATNKIEVKLINEIDTAIIDFENQKNIFIFMSIIAISLVTLLALHIAVRLTKNLNKVLLFLSKTNGKETDIVLDVRGSDELSHFAKEVKILTMKRIEQNKKILKSKEEADIAKQQAIEASKAKSVFLANMSHEIRTPLNGVIGMLEVLNNTSLTTTQKDYLTTVETSSHLLLNLINDVLDFSKIESGVLELNPISTAIRETVYDVAAIVYSKIKEKGIELKINIDKDVPQQVVVDDQKLRQILMNLMSNSVKFTKNGCIEIGIKKINQSSEKVKLEFYVKDTGIGIERDCQNKIFKAFEQEDSSTTKQFGGTGLGLSISNQFVELMGGEFNIKSMKGFGSEFYFELELRTEKQIKKKKLDSNTNIYLVGRCDDKISSLNASFDFYDIKIKEHVKSIDALKKKINEKDLIILVEEDLLRKEMGVDLINLKNKYNSSICLVRDLPSNFIDFENNLDSIINYPLLGDRFINALIHCSEDKKEESKVLNVFPSNKSQIAHVLIAEDNLTNQKIVSLHLEKLGCSYDIVNNGQEAIDLFLKKDNNYDLVFMDYMMPVKNGLETTKEMRIHEKNNNLLETPIVALTASVMNEDVEMFYENGMNDCLQKPFNTKELSDKIVNATKDSESKKLAHEKKLEELKEPSMSSKRIMLIEDNEINKKVASLLLSNAGYEHEMAEDGQLAVDYYKKSPSSFSLLLMDCMMPNKDGYEATKEIRQYEKINNLPRIPILALTASIVDEDVKKCFDSGMDAFIAKPIKKEILLNELSKYLKEKVS